MTWLSNRSLLAASVAALIPIAPTIARADPPEARVVETPPVDAPAAEETPAPRASKSVLIAGISLFAGSYVLSAVFGAASLGQPQGKMPELFAPVVGPWIAAWSAGKRKPIDNMPTPANFVVPALFGILGLAQDIGALCLLTYSLHQPSPSPTHTALRVAPYLGLGHTGLVGSF